MKKILVRSRTAFNELNEIYWQGIFSIFDRIQKEFFITNFWKLAKLLLQNAIGLFEWCSKKEKNILYWVRKSTSDFVAWQCQFLDIKLDAVNVLEWGIGRFCICGIFSKPIPFRQLHLLLHEMLFVRSIEHFE